MLEGNNIKLVGIEPEDVQTLFDWRSEFEVYGRYNPITFTSKHDLKKEFDQSPNQRVYFIIDKKGNKVGLVGYSGEMPLLLEIGFIVIPSERKKGYCTEAIKLFLDFLFLQRPIERIQAKTVEKNIPGQKTLEKAGFKFEGINRKTLFIMGEWVNLKLYSILREEWNGPNILKI